MSIIRLGPPPATRMGSTGKETAKTEPAFNTTSKLLTAAVLVAGFLLHMKSTPPKGGYRS